MSTIPTSPNTLAGLNKSYTLVKRMPHFFPTNSRRRHSQTRFFLSGDSNKRRKPFSVTLFLVEELAKGTKGFPKFFAFFSEANSSAERGSIK